MLHQIKNNQPSSSSPIIMINNQSAARPTTKDRAAQLALIYLLIIVTCLQVIDANEQFSANKQSENNQQQKQHSNNNNNNIRDPSSNNNNQRKNSLEAELESIVAQHDSSDLSDRSLADAIISRLMVDNLAANDLTAEPTSNDELFGGSGGVDTTSGDTEQQLQLQLAQQGFYPGQTPSSSVGSSQESLKLKKLFSMVRAYQDMLNGGAGGLSAASLPMLPAGQAATSKRATKLAGNYLQQRQNLAKNPNAYARNTFDFGLGKRPDTTGGASSNILRFGGDSLSGGGGSGVPAANQFGKRPSAHRYDFGLGKRVASSAYPRYDFGLGKRAPNTIRYDFGLGK